jgi:glutaredoxin
MKEVHVFSSNGCQPCKLLKAKLQTEGIKFKERLYDNMKPDEITKIKKYAIRSVPTTIIFDGENIIKRFDGFHPNIVKEIKSEMKIVV